MKGIVFFDVDTQYGFMRKDGKLYVPDAESIIPNLKKLTQFAKKRNISVVASVDKHFVKNHRSKTRWHVAYRKLSAWFLSMLENIPYFTSTLDLRPSVKDMMVYFRHINELEDASKNFPPDCMAGAKGHKKIPETRLSNAIPVPNRKLNNKKIKELKEKNRIIIEKQEHNAFSNPNLKSILNGTKKAYVYGVATDYCVKAAVLGLRKMGVETYIITDAIKPIFKKNEKKDLNLFKKKGAKFLTTSQLLNKKVL